MFTSNPQDKNINCT